MCLKPLPLPLSLSLSPSPALSSLSLSNVAESLMSLCAPKEYKGHYNKETKKKAYIQRSHYG